MSEQDDWERATYAPLAEVDPRLAQRLRARFVRRFAARARLSDRLRDEAEEQLVLDQGLTAGGTRILRADLPLGCGQSWHEWDGSQEDADGIVDSMADTAGGDLFDDLAQRERP